MFTAAEQRGALWNGKEIMPRCVWQSVGVLQIKGGARSSSEITSLAERTEERRRQQAPGAKVAARPQRWKKKHTASRTATPHFLLFAVVVLLIFTQAKDHFLSFLIAVIFFPHSNCIWNELSLRRHTAAVINKLGAATKYLTSICQ